MENNRWINETLTREPEEFQKLNSSTYIQRRNIIQSRADGSYTCESRKITADEYEEIMSKRTADKEAVILKTMIAEFTRAATITAEYQDGYEAAKILLGGE